MVAQIFRVLGLGDLHSWEVVSDRVSFIRQGFKRPGKGGRTSKIKALYIGCASYSEALQVKRDMVSRLNHCRIEIRSKGLRSVDWCYEVKIQGDFELSFVFVVAGLVDQGSLRTSTMTRQVASLAPESTPIDRPQTLVPQASFWSRVLPSWNPSLSINSRRAIASYA